MPTVAANPVIAPAPPAVDCSPIPLDALGGSDPTCTALEDLQDEMDALQQGDTLSVEADHVFAGNFELPERAGAGWICVRSTGAIPSPGTRVTPADAVTLARIMTPNHSAAFAAYDGLTGQPAAQGLRLVGLEIYNDPTYDDSSTFATPQYQTLLLGHPYAQADAGASHRYDASHTISGRHILERCWVHGADGLVSTIEGTMRHRHQFKGVVANGPDIRICDSRIEDYIAVEDTASIWTLVSPGPLHVENCYLAATGQGFFTGGSWPLYNGGVPIIPSDIKILRNFMEKKTTWDFVNQPPEWDGTHWSIKPALELKTGLRVLAEGNHCHYSFLWPAFTYDSVDPQDRDDFGLRRLTIEDVMTRNNLVTSSIAMFQIWVGSNSVKRVAYHNNLGRDIRWHYAQGPGNPGVGANVNGNMAKWSISSTVIEEGVFLGDLSCEHNTCLCDRSGHMWEGVDGGGILTRFRSRNNVLGFGRSGNTLSGNPYVAVDSAMDGFATDWAYHREALIHGPNYYADNPNLFSGAPEYPPNSYNAGYLPANCAADEYLFPGDPVEAGIDYDTGILAIGSSLRAGGAHQASDGLDNGVDHDALNAALGGDTPVVNPRRRAKGFKASSVRT